MDRRTVLTKAKLNISKVILNNACEICEMSEDNTSYFFYQLKYIIKGCENSEIY